MFTFDVPDLLSTLAGGGYCERITALNVKLLQLASWDNPTITGGELALLSVSDQRLLAEFALSLAAPCDLAYEVRRSRREADLTQFCPATFSYLMLAREVAVANGRHQAALLLGCPVAAEVDQLSDDAMLTLARAGLGYAARFDTVAVFSALRTAASATASTKASANLLAQVARSLRLQHQLHSRP